MHPVEALLLPAGWLLRNRRPDEAASIASAPELATGNRITLTSPAFGDGQVVPARYCGQFIGDDISPALTRSALPAGTKGLVFVLEDLDNPGAIPGIHTIAAFAPTGGGLPEGALTPDDPRFQFLPNRRRQARYSGPRPLLAMARTATATTSTPSTPASTSPRPPPCKPCRRLSRDMSWPAERSPARGRPERRDLRRARPRRRLSQAAERPLSGRRRSSAFWIAGGT